jgi:hypothetical protein
MNKETNLPGDVPKTSPPNCPSESDVKGVIQPENTVRKADVSGNPQSLSLRSWRDSAIFGRLDNAIITAESSAKSHDRPRRQPLSSARTKELEEFVRKQIAPISAFMQERCEPQLRHRPKAVKEVVLRIVRKELPPKGRAPGRPYKEEITNAVKMQDKQQQEVRRGKRKNVDWKKIAAECILGYRAMRFDWQIKRAIKRLKNSVRARVISQSRGSRRAN